MVLSIVNASVLGCYSQKLFHILQLKSYKTNEFLKWYISNKVYLFNLFFSMLSILFCLVINVANIFIKNVFISVIGILFYFVCVVAFINRKSASYQKVKFVKTPRMIRLFITYFFLNIIICFILNMWFKNIYFLFYAAIPLNIVINALLLCLAKIINEPIEKMVNYYYILKSKNKLSKMPELIKVGITGSAGKTSVKNILSHILSVKYKVFATPNSYNTPMGICRSINEQLPYDAEVFIAELGAKQKNDIKYLCEYLNVDFGIVTSVSKQHISTFKTMNNIFLTKKELPDFLTNKLCVFNIDDVCCEKMYVNKTGEKCGVSIKIASTDIYATDIKVDNFITKFVLHFEGKSYDVTTCLLGSHNVTNILLATALAIHFNIKVEDVIARIRTLKQVPHRLEYIKSNNGINILDDSFNCSPISSENALNVLQSCMGKKVVCTPGIVEGGKEQHQINYALAKKISEVADEIIVVGDTNRYSLSDGLDATKKIYYVKNLKEAQFLFSKILVSNDTLLLLNDLPDDYS